MKSNRQKRTELQARRDHRREAQARAADLAALQRRRDERVAALKAGAVEVNAANLAPSGSYSTPDFVVRGWYEPVPFTCEGCGVEEVWTPHQQKWWYEVARGGVFTTARLCRSCRRRERDRKAAARKTHQEGLARKMAGRTP